MEPSDLEKLSNYDLLKEDKKRIYDKYKNKINYFYAAAGLPAILMFYSFLYLPENRINFENYGKNPVVMEYISSGRSLESTEIPEVKKYIELRNKGVNNEYSFFGGLCAMVLLMSIGSSHESEMDEEIMNLEKLHNSSYN